MNFKKCKKCKTNKREKKSMQCEICNVDKEFEIKKQQFETIEECVDLIDEYREAKLKGKI